MAYEIYERQVIRTTSPMITLNSRGRMVFNVSATRILHDAGVESVFLLWDKDSRKFAVRATNSKRDPRVCSLRYSGSGSKWAAVSAKGFLAHIGHDLSTTKAYPATWNSAESMFEVSMDRVQEESEDDERLPARRSMPRTPSARRHVVVQG